MIAVFDEALEITIVSAPKKLFVAEKVIDEERREKKRKEQDVLRLATGGVDGIGLDVAVALVGRRQRHPVRGGVDEPLFVDAVRDDQQVIGAGQIPVDARALRQIGVPRFLDVGVAPHIQLSPVRVRGREEIPVLHRLAEHGVGDVVRGKPEGLDAQQRLSVFR